MVIEGGVNGLFDQTRNMAPIYPVHLHDVATGNYILDDAGNKLYDASGRRKQDGERNVIWQNELNMDNTARKTVNGSLFAEITFLNDFRAKVSGSMDTQSAINSLYVNSTVGDGKAVNGSASNRNEQYKTYTMLEQLTYNKTINDLYDINVLVAHENYSYKYIYNYSRKEDEIFPNNPYLANFKTMTSINSYENNRRTESYLSRIQLNYNEKYYLDGSFRRDGSSRFHPDNRWGNFYSVGAAWNISKEAFMDNIHDLSNLKLRANYGETGNDASVGTYGWMGLYEIDAKTSSLTQTQRESKSIKWEASTSFGLAVDGRAFKRVNFTLEYFDKRSRDLLFYVNLPQSSGSTGNKKSPTLLRNIGSVANRGVELSLDAELYRNKNLSWHAAFSATTLNNKILKLPEENRAEGILSGNHKFIEGHSMYDFWLYQYAGVDQMTGRSVYLLDEAQRTAAASDILTINGVDYTYKATYAKRDFSGSPIPKLMGNFSTGVNYKGFALDVLFTYGLGNKVYDAPYKSLMSFGAGNAFALHQDILNSWTAVPEGMTNDSPNRIDRNATPIIDPTYNNDNNAGSSRWLINGSYFMFKNVNLSYSLPKQWIQSLALSNARLNATVENLFLLSARKGLNSQMSFNGEIADQASMPRVISFGVKVDF
jgi:TonB-linked SusC/RagA family outer membrane protein